MKNLTCLFCQVLELGQNFERKLNFDAGNSALTELNRDRFRSEDWMRSADHEVRFSDAGHVRSDVSAAQTFGSSPSFGQNDRNLFETSEAVCRFEKLVRS
jgi:hypothetical protein